jgi:C-terminal processing protease CtpA/Prc
VELIAPFDVARNWSWYLDYPPNFNPNIVERNNMGADYRIIGPFRAQWLTNDIAYIRYSSFASLLAAENLDELARIYGNAKGIIWDIRDNTGGIITNINQIMSRIVNEKTQVGWIRYKQGPGYNDFSEFYPYNIEPAGDYKLNGKIILLTNRKVYSAANFFAAAMLALPQVTLLGDQTGGGGGAPYTGQLLNGWQYTFSTTQLVNLQKEQIENGVPPDIKADMNPAKEAQGIDSIIEQALDILGR